MKRATAFYTLIYHFTWGTKDRLALITPEVEARLYPYIIGKCEQLGYRLYALNGTEDHIHLLVGLTPSMRVADIAKNLKGASSHYINKESGLETTLYWQDGYGVITLREADIPAVCKYIQNQRKHHQGDELDDRLEYKID